MNISKRLMDKAVKNTVLCDASTAEEAENAFWFKEFTETEVKRPPAERQSKTPFSFSRVKVLLALQIVRDGGGVIL